MNEALIQDPEHDIDDENTSDQQETHALLRILERFRGALEQALNCRREADLLFHAVQMGNCIAQRHPGGKLNEIVTAGSCPIWLTDRGWVPRLIWATADNGTDDPIFVVLTDATRGVDR